MSEEEIIEDAKEFIKINILYSNKITLLEIQLKYYQKIMQGLLDLYEQEKEKNKELKAINKMQEYRITVIDERELVSKDKIKGKIKLLEEMNWNNEIDKHFAVDLLEELLKD